LFQMLLILIPTLWLTIVAFVVVLCRGAARADALMTVGPTELGAPATGRRTLAVLDVRRDRQPRDPRLRERAPHGSGERAGATLVRGRGERCVTGS
jgi:hypothetical protein